jgi:hypothetical protein
MIPLNIYNRALSAGPPTEGLGKQASQKFEVTSLNSTKGTYLYTTYSDERHEQNHKTRSSIMSFWNHNWKVNNLIPIYSILCGALCRQSSIGSPHSLAQSISDQSMHSVHHSQFLFMCLLTLSCTCREFSLGSSFQNAVEVTF